MVLIQWPEMGYKQAGEFNIGPKEKTQHRRGKVSKNE